MTRYDDTGSKSLFSLMNVKINHLGVGKKGRTRRYGPVPSKTGQIYAMVLGGSGSGYFKRLEWVVERQPPLFQETIM